MFENINIRLLALLAIVAIAGYFMYTKYMGNDEPKVNNVAGHNDSIDDGLNSIPEERDEGVDEEYRTNEFAPNFLNDMDRAGVFDLQ